MLQIQRTGLNNMLIHPTCDVDSKVFTKTLAKKDIREWRTRLHLQGPLFYCVYHFTNNSFIDILPLNCTSLCLNFILFCSFLILYIHYLRIPPMSRFRGLQVLNRILKLPYHRIRWLGSLIIPFFKWRLGSSGTLENKNCRNILELVLVFGGALSSS